jgi:hypothetical protein
LANGSIGKAHAPLLPLATALVAQCEERRLRFCFRQLAIAGRIAGPTVELTGKKRKTTFALQLIGGTLKSGAEPSLAQIEASQINIIGRPDLASRKNLLSRTRVAQ